MSISIPAVFRRALATITLVVLGGVAPAQEPFLAWDFEAPGSLDDFFSPVGANFSTCGLIVPVLPSGTSEVVDGELRMTNDPTFGINILALRPSVVERSFPALRNYAVRLRVRFGTATQFVIDAKTRLELDEASGETLSQFERAYSFTVFPGGVDPTFQRGMLAIAEFTGCHQLVKHPEWPRSLETGVARIDPGVAVEPDRWYWVEAIVWGNEDGGPVTLGMSLWPEDGVRPEKSELVAFDNDGLELDDATRDPLREVQFALAVSLDRSDFVVRSQDFRREPGGTVSVDDIALIEFPFPEDTRAKFTRGDSNADGGINLTDAIYTLNFLFQGDEPPTCPDAADGNDDGSINITDSIFLLNYLFTGGGAPPDPGASCGEDPSEDSLPECVFERC